MILAPNNPEQGNDDRALHTKALQVLARKQEQEFETMTVPHPDLSHTWIVKRLRRKQKCQK